MKKFINQIENACKDYCFSPISEIKNYGRFVNLYNQNGKCTNNAYLDACEEFAKYAY